GCGGGTVGSNEMCARFASGSKIPVGKPFSTGVAISKQNFPGGARGKREKSKIFPNQVFDRQTTLRILRSETPHESGFSNQSTNKGFTIRPWPAVAPASPATECWSPGAHPRRYRWRIDPAFQISTAEC